MPRSRAITRLSSQGACVSSYLHSGQISLIRRWAMNASTLEATRYGSSPISTSLVMALAASLVCRVENTRWPVRATRIAISAVSRSLTSPTMITSGSCLRMLRKPRAKSSPISGWTWIWVMPGISYSMGSSMVMIFLSRVFILLRQA